MQLDAQQIRQLRSELGWTQQQLADICGLSLRTIQRVEVSGLASLETTKALAVAFNKERNELLDTQTQDEPAAVPQQITLPGWLLAITFAAGVFCGAVLLRFAGAFWR